MRIPLSVFVKFTPSGLGIRFAVFGISRCGNPDCKWLPRSSFPSTLTPKFPSHPSAVRPAYTRYGLRFIPPAQVNTPPTFSFGSANVLPDDRTIVLGPHITELHFHAPYLPSRRNLPFRTPCLPGPRCVSSTSVVELSLPGLNWEKADLIHTATTSFRDPVMVGKKPDSSTRFSPSFRDLVMFEKNRILLRGYRFP